MAGSSSKREAGESLARSLREEDIKWAQRAKDKAVTECYNNARFFHLIASGKHMKKGIFQIKPNEGTIVDHENLK